MDGCPVCHGASKGETMLHWQHDEFLKTVAPGEYPYDYLRSRFRAWELEKRKKAEVK